MIDKCPYRNNCPDYATSKYCIDNDPQQCPNFENEHRIYNFLENVRFREKRLEQMEKNDYE